ncbi:MAG TPA: FRG domain-containing protein [Candidatus Thermoplasmatota archaeon]|nr:FRG domain-containing protein [Candidatus Thermoplasmatota archaeon]
MGQLVETCGQPRFVYRGGADASWGLETALDRLGVEAGGRPHSFAQFERALLDSFARAARGFLRHEPKNTWEYLALGQHFGLPTRLLDWTFSPLVALYFAVEPPSERDRAVWTLDWEAMHRHFGLKAAPYDAASLEDEFGRELGNVFEIPARGRPPSFACLFMPPAVDDRIVAQAGVFTVATETSLSLDAFLAAAEASIVLRKVVIPSDAAPGMRAELDTLGFTASRLFPGLDGLARSVRARFTELARQTLTKGGTI